MPWKNQALVWEVPLNPQELFWVSGPSFCSHVRHMSKNSHNISEFSCVVDVPKWFLRAFHTYLLAVNPCLDRLFSHVVRCLSWWEGLHDRPGVAMHCVCPTSTKLECSQRGSDQAAEPWGHGTLLVVLRTMGLAVLCLGSRCCASESYAAEPCVGREGLRETQWQKWGCWVLELLAESCSVGVPRSCLVCALRVGCRLSWVSWWAGCRWRVPLWNAMVMLPELWHFCLVLSSGGNGIWQ